MKRAYTFLIFLALSTSTYATHILGGEITWKCDGNGQYIFKVVIYRDCSDLSYSVTQEGISWNGGAPITCFKTGVSTISPQCYNSSASIKCDSTIYFSPVERYVFESNPVTLPPIIPATGFTFYKFIQARPITDNTTNGGANGYMLRAVMYPYLDKNGLPFSPAQCNNSSPQFEEYPRYAFTNDSNSFYLDGFEVDSQDSIAFKWAPSVNYALSFPGSAISYSTGYTFNQPLPGAVQDPSNSAPVLDPNGFLNFRSVTLGRFTTCYKIESWRNGQLTAEVYRDFEMQINTDPGLSGPCATAGNNPPSVSFSWIPGYDTLTPIYFNGRITRYQMDVLAGDTVMFEINHADYDLKSNCSPQVMTANVVGSSMSRSLTGNSDCDGIPCAQLVSQNSGGGYSSSLNNSARFEWATDTSHVFGPSGVGEHWFSIKGTDDHCVVPGENQVQCVIRVHRPIYSNHQNLRICSGDSVQAQIFGDTSSLLWNPAAAISCTTCANPIFYPTTTTTYVVADLNTGYQMEFNVEVDSPVIAPYLVQNGNNLTVSNVNLYDTVIWQRSHLPFDSKGNNYSAWLSGDYWVDAYKGSCVEFSDTINYSFPDNLAGNTGNGGVFDSARVEDAIYTMSIRLNNEPYYELNVIYLNIIANDTAPDLTGLTCRIEDLNQQAVFNVDSVRRLDDEVVAFYGNGQLIGGDDYRLVLGSKPDFVLPTYRPSTWPVVSKNGRVYVFNSLKQVPNKPAKSYFAYPFFNLGLKWHIGIGESESMEFDVFPNPASETISIETTNEAHFEILNSIGQTMLSDILNQQKIIDVSLIPQGIYLVKVTTQDGLVGVKRITIAR